MAAHKAEKHRHQIDRAEQADTETEAQDTTERKGSPFERGKPQHRMRARAPCATGKCQVRSRWPAADQRRTATASRLVALASGRSRAQCKAAAIKSSEITSSFLNSSKSVACRGRRKGVTEAADQSGNDIDQEQPRPRPGRSDEPADHGTDGRRQHRDHAADRGRDRVKARRKQQEHRREYRRESTRRRKIPGLLETTAAARRSR